MLKRMVPLGILVSSLGLLGGCVSKNEELVNSQEIPVERIEEIAIRYQSDSLNIYQSATEEIRLEEYLVPKKGNTKAKVTTSGKKLSIASGKRKPNWFNGNNESHIDIYLPKKYQHKLTVEVTDGDITSGSLLKLADFSAKAASGDLSFKRIDARNIDLAVSSGEISAEQLYADKTNLKTTSGNIELGKVLSKSLNAEGSSGEIEIEEFRGDGNFQLTSGNLSLGNVQGSADMLISSGEIEANFSQVTGDIRAQGTSGNIKLTIPKDLSFNFVSQLTSGSITTFFSEDLAEKGRTTKQSIGKDPQIDISVKLTSGDIDIEGE